MKVLAVIIVALFAFLFLPVHYLVILYYTNAVEYYKTPIILLVIIAFLFAIFTAGYNEERGG